MNNKKNYAQDCTTDNPCPNMIRQITWSKSMRLFLGGSMMGLLISAIVGMIFQYKGMAAQISTAEQIGLLKASFDTLSVSVTNMTGEINYIKRKQRLQDFDTQTTRIYMNKIGEKNGFQPITIRPFEPPTYEDIKEKE